MLHLILLLSVAPVSIQTPPAPIPDKAPQTVPAEDPWKVSVPAVSNATCPIMGKPISLKLFTDTALGRIYICCKACIKDIQGDVELAYRTAYPTTVKLTNKICPVTRKAIVEKSPRVEFQGMEFSVLDAQVAKTVADDAQAVLAKLVNSELIDVGNLICPVTKEPVAKNTVVIIGKELVRLSSVKALGAVEKEPKQMLLKAREIRAEQDARALKEQDLQKAPEDKNGPHKKG